MYTVSENEYDTIGYQTLSKWGQFDRAKPILENTAILVIRKYVNN